MIMSAIEAYKIFQSVKLHFTSEKYNFFKSGKVKISEKTFSTRRDRFVFQKLATKYNREELISLVLSNALKNDSVWSMNLLEPEATDNMTEYLNRIQSITYNLKQDTKKLLDWALTNQVSVDRILISNGRYPPLLDMTMKGEISLETLVIMNEILGFFDMWKRKIDDTIIWPAFAHKCEKYSAFVLPRVDLQKMKKIIKDELCT